MGESEDGGRSGAGRSFRRPPLPPVDPDEQSFVEGYIQHKAARFLELGLEAYREGDALGRPTEPLEEGEREGLERGCQELVVGRGFSSENPLTGLSVPDFYRLMDTFHFRVTGKKSQYPKVGILDEMRVEHFAASQCGALFNLVIYDREDEA
ncbi:MAG: hypothetical protein CMH55_09740 [Myxococcales bacterium]|nr:hypothetical protein [Myxococcales bacterium]